MKRSFSISLLVTCLIGITGCQVKHGDSMNTNTAAVEANLAFTCTKEVDHLPPLDPQADVLFKQARAMQKASGAKSYDTIASLYRQAAAKNHYKAMINLQNMLYQRLAKPAYGKTAPEEAVELSERLMKLGVPGGYYSMGQYLENGYGVKRDKAASLAYFRKAADLGSPEGQYVVGKLFMTEQFEDPSNPDPYTIKYKPNPAYRPEIGRTMLDCSANQGYGNAAYELALDYKFIQQNDKKALMYYQLSVRYGNTKAAYKLSRVFSGPNASDKLNYMAQLKDLERAHRYKLISDEIDSNPSARFPDIDKIVPLPPAELPEWDGTFEYKKEPQPQ